VLSLLSHSPIDVVPVEIEIYLDISNTQVPSKIRNQYRKISEPVRIEV
jgi:hypothetical protein